MNAGGTYGVVDVQTVVDELDGIDEYRATHESDAYCSDGRHEVASGCYAYEPGQDAVEGERERWFAILHPGDKHGCHSSGHCCQVGGEEHVADGCAVHFACSGQLRAGVESEPSEPQDEHAERCQREVVAGYGAALAVGRILADAGAECHGADQCQHASHAMHDGRTGKVVEHVAEGGHHEAVGRVIAEPTAAPCPVALDGVDEERDDG